jgi:hypothetical protein
MYECSDETFDGTGGQSEEKHFCDSAYGAFGGVNSFDQFSCRCRPPSRSACGTALSRGRMRVATLPASLSRSLFLCVALWGLRAVGRRVLLGRLLLHLWPALHLGLGLLSPALSLACHDEAYFVGLLTG